MPATNLRGWVDPANSLRTYSWWASKRADGLGMRDERRGSGAEVRLSDESVCSDAGVEDAMVDSEMFPKRLPGTSSKTTSLLLIMVPSRP